VQKESQLHCHRLWTTPPVTLELQVTNKTNVEASKATEKPIKNFKSPTILSNRSNGLSFSGHDYSSNNYIFSKVCQVINAKYKSQSTRTCSAAVENFHLGKKRDEEASFSNKDKLEIFIAVRSKCYPS